MKKIVFGITGLTLGGAERVLVDLANRLCDTYDVTIQTIYAKGELEKQLSEQVTLKSIYPTSYQNLSYFQKRIIPLKMLLFKRHFYHQYIQGDYDVEIAFLEGPITRLFSVKNRKTTKMAWVHNDIGFVFGKGMLAKLKKKIDRAVYQKYKTIVFVSKDNLSKFNQIYPDLRNKELMPIHKTVIYNYINQESIQKKADEMQEEVFSKEQMNFVTVARLVKQKGIDRLITVHRKLIKNGLQHQIYVIGDGPERENLEKQIKQEKVENTFHLLGKKENPYPYIKNSDCFCLLSYFEGYGMVLEEAKILDKPILITDTAAREAIDQYPKGMIVDNTQEGIYRGIEEKIQTKNKAQEKTNDQYNNEDILKKVKKLIGEQNEG